MSIKNLIHGSWRCVVCQEEVVWSAESTYGAAFEDRTFTLGDRIPWKGGFVSGQYVRDSRRKLLYLNTGALDCPSNDQLPEPAVAVIEQDIIKSFFAMPGPDIHTRNRMYGFLSGLSPMEEMLLVQRYGYKKLVDTQYSVAHRLSQGNWPDIAHRMLTPFKPEDWRGARLPRAQQVWSEEFDEYLKVLPDDFWLRVKDRTLNALAGQADQASDRPNLLHLDDRCPRCGHAISPDVVFRYGHCGGYRYHLGEIVDWERPGWVPCVRDSVLQYREVRTPKCEGCGHQTTGFVTVAGDRIESVALLPWEIERFVDQNAERFGLQRQLPPGSEITCQETPHYQLSLLVREYGADSVIEELKEFEKSGSIFPLHDRLARSQDKE